MLTVLIVYLYYGSCIFIDIDNIFLTRLTDIQKSSISDATGILYRFEGILSAIRRPTKSLNRTIVFNQCSDNTIPGALDAVLWEVLGR